jgi:hypothetical protein
MPEPDWKPPPSFGPSQWSFAGPSRFAHPVNVPCSTAFRDLARWLVPAIRPFPSRRVQELTDAAVARLAAELQDEGEAP